MNKLILLCLILIHHLSIAQGVIDLNNKNYKKCNTTFLVNKEYEETPEYLTIREKLIDQDREFLNNSHLNATKEIITLPVVIHVIHRNTHSNIGTGTNISNAKIEDALRILNEDYSKTNSEFPSPPRSTFVNYAGNANLEFCLATIDEDGNPTNGITRTSTTKDNFDPDSESNDMKRNNTGGKDGWDPARYLNIWICDLAVSASGGMTLGYAYLPGLPSWQAWKDGLVVDYQFFGTIQGSVGDGRTATHEIGHYLGLQHTFCESSSGGCCDNDDNNVDDTPATDGVYWGNVNASTSNNTCNDLLYGFSNDLLDMDENFMSYSQNTWMFSQDQVNAMNATLFGYRSSLRNSTVPVNCTGTIGTGYNDLGNTFNIDIFPNPTNGKLIIKDPTNNIEHILIRNTLGQIVINTNSKELNISSLENGIYVIEITTKHGVKTEKIILEK